MKTTLAWLEEHLETESPLEAIADTLSMIGLEVDGIEDRAKGLEPFVVARVVSAEPIPDTKLRVCRVDNGTETLQVVCGAPNARAGMKAVFAGAGVHVPGTGLDLKKTTIRGVESNGMLVSERELGLSDEHEGIIELPADAPVGKRFIDVAGLADIVIEIGLTPNRGDCAGTRGIARDLAAAGHGRLLPARYDSGPAIPDAFQSRIGIRIEDETACPLFAARLIRGVANGPSPAWLQQRLRAVGLRPISALVDVTNYFSLDRARPLHVFDAAKVKGDLTVRLATGGETLLALDGKEYVAEPGMTLICDETGPVSIAGIMGGEATGCTEATTEVLLESALWDPRRIAATGRALGIHSDARYRFERGVDPAYCIPAVDAATRMILELCGGEASGLVIAGAEPAWRRSYAFRPGRLASLGGVDVPAAESARILRALGFEPVEKDAALDVAVPPWRPDVHGEADLVEEVLRIHGFDKIPATPLPRITDMPRTAVSPAQARPVRVRRQLAARGMLEALTFSFMPSADAALFGGGAPELRLANPISADLDQMRPSVLPNLLAAAKRNADRGLGDGALFEIGPQFAGPAPEQQSLVASGLRWGRTGPRHWAAAPRAVDVFDAKADALAALGAAGAPTDNLQTATGAPGWFHPGRSGVLRLGPAVLAAFGELHPEILAHYDLKGPAVGFTVMLDAVPLPKAKGGGKTKPALVVSPFQPVERDFAFVVDESVTADAVIRAARQADKALIAAVAVFDLFAGGNIPAGKKSLAIQVTLQPTRATLTDAEIEAAGQRIVAAVAKATGAVLRG